MARYTFRFFAGERLEHTEEYDLDNDQIARDLARAISREADVEIWERERFVGRLAKSEPKPQQ